MIRTTPFHPRLSALNTEGLYTHWQGHLSALRYGNAPKHEYFAVRNAVGVFDTSPLFKYRFSGPDAARLLSAVTVRDVTGLAPGRARYTLWCDDRGFVLQDGVVLRRTEDLLLTAASPCLSWFTAQADGLRVSVEDLSDDYGLLAVQGPRSRATLAPLTDAVTRLGYFGHQDATVAGRPVLVSRTGHTGDLGYEVWVPRDHATAVLDAVLEAGRPHGIRPFGEEALMVLRIEAGLPLAGVEWTDSSLAWTDAQRVTPDELGLGWMLADLDRGRSFLGARALRQARAGRTARWAAVGLLVDRAHWDGLHREAGLPPPTLEQPLGYEVLLRDDDGSAAGYVTSLVHSPALQRHVGLARVRPDLAAPGTVVHLETTVNHLTTTVRAATTTLPLLDLPRKAARP